MQLAFFRGEAWSSDIRVTETDSTILLMRLLERLWNARPNPRAKILQVGMTLTRLVERANHTPELFAIADEETLAVTDEKQHRLDETLDKLRARYGRSVVYFGSVQEARESAPMRISFTHIPKPEVEGD